MGGMTIFLCPFDGLMLRLAGHEDVLRMVLDQTCCTTVRDRNRG